MTIRTTLAIALTASTAIAGSALADYPEKPITLMVGFSAGGGTDTSARGFASYVHEAEGMNGMPMVVVNRPGGSGQQAAAVVKDAAPDGYTLYIINSGTFAASDMSTPNAPVQPLDDLTLIGCMTQLITGLQVAADHPAQSASEWVEMVKSSGETVRWSASGASTMHALVGHLFLDTNEIAHQIIPFEGGSKARNALAGGQVTASFNGTQLVSGFEEQIKVLGIPSTERDPANPDIPTFGEQGLDALNVTGPMCLWGPNGMPDDVVAQLEETVEYVANNNGFGRFLGKSGLAPIFLDQEEGVAATQRLYDALGPVVEQIAANQ
ncbi:MAG: tripartite tricarboxylate transporter substrate binding protein [Pseudomonadota bacterium]